MAKFKKFLLPILIIITSLFVCFVNYSPNTFLTGWDTLHPEFNFSLNFKRLLFGIWHPEQGLGAMPAHAQMADLPRVAILYLFHFFLPLNFLRYSYIFLCLILGPLGIYFLSKNIFHSSHHRHLISFVGSLLYLFNLSTVQQFYVPFEMFPTQWAFLPWIILFSIKYLKQHHRRDLILFSVFTIFSAPQAYASQLWYAFFFIYSLFLFIYFLLHKESKNKTIRLFLFTLLLNAFWLIPNIFYILTSSSSPQFNRDNRLYSQEYLLKNRANGTITDTAIVRGFYLNWSVYNFDRQRFDDLLPQWKQHFNNPAVLVIGYLIFALSLAGLIISFAKKDKLLISLSPFFIIPFGLLSNKIIVFSQIFNFLILNSTIKEAFRFIFTKLSILLIFGIVIFFVHSLDFIFEKISQTKFFKIVPLVIISSIIFYCLPILQGQLISSKVRLNIPSSYFQLFQFMSSQDSGRILSLPLNQPSGWQYYRWGYQGSGFLWFNLKQDLLDRDSDRWNNKNEQSYKEFFNSLYSQDFDQFSQNLQKYNIKYLIWDKSIINPSPKNNQQITFEKEIGQLLDKLVDKNIIKKINQFEDTSVYQTDIDSTLISTKSISNFVGPEYQWGYFDTANQSDYVTTDKNTTYYPFRDILGPTQQIDTQKISIKEKEDQQWQIDLKTNDQYFQIPQIDSTESIIVAGVKYFASENKIKLGLPLPQETISNINTEFYIASNSSKIKVNDVFFDIPSNRSDKVLGTVNLYLNSNNYINNQPINLNFDNNKTLFLNQISLVSTSLKYPEKKHLTTLNSTDNYDIDLSSLPHSSGYIIAINSRYFSGIPLRFCLRNDYSFICSIEDQVNKNSDFSWDYFLVPSTGNDLGYHLSISSLSYGGFPSESIINDIEIIPIPFNLLSQIKSDDQESITKDFLVFDQSFSNLWLAFYFNGFKPTLLKNHVLFNNWANAWELPQNIKANQVKIIFWPQILQLIGFGTTIFILIYTLKRPRQ